MKNKLLHVAAVFILLSFSNVNFAQVPDLGTAANFVLFSSNGALGNTGTSHLTGNVGTNNGAVTGFCNVNGVIHSSNGASASAKTDLLGAYNQLNGISGGFALATPLGNGDTLNSGVYSISANTTLNQNLILDGQGNPNAFFIFKIQGTFSANPAAQIILVKGAKACNVFWKIEGLVNLFTGSTMRGTVIANNAAINMSTGVTLEGRALSTAGAVNVNQVLAYIPSGCERPILTGPPAPDLATAACYALFSGDGGVTNAGITNITGDIGTNEGLTLGHNPLTVNGMIHLIPDGSTAACAADLLNAYTYLNTLPYDIELTCPAQFGNNLVLTPHTYLMNAATSFIGTVYLNAEGNTNAVFVIQINGALTTGTYAKVILTNGTQAKNVFWKVDGAVNINDYSEFKGTIICNNGAISLNTGVVLNGRALTTSGALSTAAITAVIPDCNRPLPVSWLYFRGKPDQENVLLEWATANKVDNGTFTIEKSRDGNAFETVATVKAAARTVNSEYQYSFTDKQPCGSCYYRISQTDNDGRKNYFRTIQVKGNMNQRLKALHYVKENFVYVQVAGIQAGKGSMELYSIDGKKMSSQNITLTKELNTYKIEKQLNKGIYLIHIKSQGEKLYHAKVMIL